MPKSVFTEGTNFTEGCAHCPFWLDGSEGRGYGCGIPAPITECKWFMKMCKEEEDKNKEG